MRRALGYKLARAEKLLAQFIAWLDERGEQHDHDRARRSRGRRCRRRPAPTGTRHRLSVVRGFAAHLHALDPAHEVPPADLLPQRPRRAVPYLYSDAEIRALMDASSVIPTPHRAATMRALIGLLAVTGMRIGEAIRLDQGDIDHRRGVLTVVESKFGKSRELAGPRDDDRGAARLPGPPRPARPGRADRRGVHLGDRDAADLLQRAPGVQADRQARRPRAALDGLPAQAARPAPHVRGQHAA